MTLIIQSSKLHILFLNLLFFSFNKTLVKRMHKLNHELKLRRQEKEVVLCEN